MALARALSRPLAGLAPGSVSIPRFHQPPRAMAGTRIGASALCSRPGARRPQSRHGIQNAQIRRLSQPPLAIHAAPRQSRQLPSRSGYDHAPPAWRATHRYRSHALLPRTRHRGRRMTRSVSFALETIRTVAWMKEAARQARADGRIVGLVPTMGALHQGHLSLIHRARQDCNPVIASIFVNPAQFGPKEDFTKYPRSFESDLAQLSAAGVDSLFAPDAAEIYPDGFRTYVNVEGLSELLEGRSRPGHFRRVATALLKLLQIVQPHFAYFGRKPAQHPVI